MTEQFWRTYARSLNWRQLGFTLLSIGCVFVSAVIAENGVVAQPAEQVLVADTNNLELRGKALFDAGQFSQAAEVLLKAVKQYQQRGDRVGEAIVLSNLALVYEQLGQWPQANQAINRSLEFLQGQSTPETARVLAQVLNTDGQLKLAQGQAQLALQVWQRSEEIFSQIDDVEAVTRSRVNQAQALQSMGQYRRSIKTLNEITAELAEQPDTLTEVVALRSLGEALRVAGELTDAREVLGKSVVKAERLGLVKEKAAAQLSLGNVLRAEGENDPKQLQAALKIYEQLATKPSESQVQALLNQFSLLVQMKDFTHAEAIWPLVSVSLQQIPLSRSSIFAYLNVDNSLSQLESTRVDTVAERAQLLKPALTIAKELGDDRAESYVLGGLGALYEETEQWAEAERLTQKALKKAINEPEIAFRWQWQLGRLQKKQGNREGAISAYSGAVKTLKSLRKDFVAVNPEVQLSFQNNVEPIHRQLVDLLLEVNERKQNVNNLEAARLTIESLQLAELDNFFREACLDVNPVLIDEVDQKAAVIYPIILPERLAVIISLPGQELKFYSTNISSNTVSRTIDRLRLSLSQHNSKRYLALSKQLYDWLIRPVKKELATGDVQTLVFVLDGELRNVPMAVLHDGNQYLIETFSVALAPGLQLIEPKSSITNRSSVLIAGLSESRKGFSALVHVPAEVNSIERWFKVDTLLNQSFTLSGIQKSLNRKEFNIVHLATHGQFSSQKNETYLLGWKGRITANQIRDLLQNSDLFQEGIELLVLSACETALGDKYAALGLAGLAVKSGARSTVGTLWKVNDKVTSMIMQEFYRLLSLNNVSKSEALRRAQILVLENKGLSQHPYYWSSFVLIGDWK